MNELMITDRKEVDKLSMTIRELMPGGSKLTVVEAQSLAQVALLHGLDPFNGEVWYLKYEDGRSIGIMAGIKGHRRAAHRQLDHEGGGNFWCEFDLLSPDDKKAMQIPDNAIAYRCRLFDSVSLRLYTEIIERLCKAGIPWADVKSLAGDRPLSTGYGYFTPGEKSKMKPSACAMKRSEADALRRRFDLPFGSAVGVNGDTDSVDAEYTVSEPAGESPAEIQAKIQAGKSASAALRGDRGDLGPELKDDYSAQQNGGNGKTTEHPAPVPDENAKPARLKYQPFVSWCNDWVIDARAAKYAKEHGEGELVQANMHHVLARVGKLGYPEVTADNVESVKRELQKYIEQEA